MVSPVTMIFPRGETRHVLAQCGLRIKKTVLSPLIVYATSKTFKEVSRPTKWDNSRKLSTIIYFSYCFIIFKLWTFSLFPNSGIFRSVNWWLVGYRKQKKFNEEIRIKTIVFVYVCNNVGVWSVQEKWMLHSQIWTFVLCLFLWLNR